FAVTVPRRLCAAEREMNLRPGRSGVDVRDPGVQIAHRAERLVHITREDRGREPELDRVRSVNRLVDVGRADERGRGPEDLLLRDPHLGIDITEDRRPVEEALVQAVLRRDLTAGEELRALALPDLGVRVDLLERRAVDDRADVDVLLEAVA